MNNISATNTSSFPRHFTSKPEGIVVCSVFALEALLIVLGNLLTIVLFAVNRAIRKKTLLLVINMAVTDLILGAVFLPIRIIKLGRLNQLWTARVTSSAFSLYFDGAMRLVFFQASLLSAAAISFERFHAINWPLQHRTLSMQNYLVVIFIVWILSVIVSAICWILEYLTTAKIRIYALTSYFFTLLLIVCFCSISIWRKFQHRVIASQQQNRALQNQRLSKTLLLVSLVALLSWLPYMIVKCLNVEFSVILYTAMFLLYSNSLVNPIVYALRIPEFRQALRLCCFRRQVAVDMTKYGRRNNRVVALRSEIELLSRDPIKNSCSANRAVNACTTSDKITERAKTEVRQLDVNTLACCGSSA